MSFKSVFKKWLRDYFTGAAAFHGPVFVLFSALTLFVHFLPGKSTSFFFILNGTLPWIFSIAVFRDCCRRWPQPPSPFLFFLGTWITGPVMFIAGVYYGYFPGLFILTFFYLILQPVMWIRKRVSLRSLWSALFLSMLCFAFFLLIASFWRVPESGKKTPAKKWEVPKPSFKFSRKMPSFH